MRIITPKRGRSFLLNLKEVINYHELLTQIALREIKVRYKQTGLGIIWAIIVSIIIFFLGYRYFKNIEMSFADVI